MIKKIFAPALCLFLLTMIIILTSGTANSQSGIDKHYPGVFRPTYTPTPASTKTDQMPNQETRDDLKKNLKVTILNETITRTTDSDGKRLVRFNLRLENKTGRTLTFYPRNIQVYDTEGGYTECRIVRSGDHPKSSTTTGSKQNDDINPNSDFRVNQDFDQKWSQKGKKPSPDYQDSNSGKKPTSNYANPSGSTKPTSSNYANPTGSNKPTSSNYANPTGSNKPTSNYANPGNKPGNYDYSNPSQTYNTYGTYMNSVSVLPRRTNEVTITCLIPENKRPSYVVIKYGKYVVGKKRIGD